MSIFCDILKRIEILEKMYTEVLQQSIVNRNNVFNLENIINKEEDDEDDNYEIVTNIIYIDIDEIL